MNKNKKKMVEIKIVQENDSNFIKIDLGMSYYGGIINAEQFPPELKNNYLDIVEKSIKYYRLDSKEKPKIISKLEFKDLPEINYYLISFEIIDNMVFFQKVIKIEVRKYLKNSEHYINEQGELLLTVKNEIKNINKTIEEEKNKDNTGKILEIENKLINLASTISNMNENINLLFEKFILLNNSIAIQQLINPNNIINNSFQNNNVPSNNVISNNIQSNNIPTNSNNNFHINTNIPNNNLPNNNLSNNNFTNNVLLNPTNPINPNIQNNMPLDNTNKFNFNLPNNYLTKNILNNTTIKPVIPNIANNQFTFGITKEGLENKNEIKNNN